MREAKIESCVRAVPSLSSSPRSDGGGGGGGGYTAAEELAAQIVDCASLLTCVNAEDAVRSIQPLSPRGRTVTACVSWHTTAAAPDDVRSVKVRFSYSEAFTCRTNSGSDHAYESLMALLVANGCGAADAVRGLVL
ncbi:hypothetical protein C3747_15g349c [Trypanosoma cruzi]|uniref:Uncharacterized protein n=2 Tax=Trypanosoma cruzi TaxID=5693 RepID=Q4D9Q6_TRYCC|nr:hypothetical protein, conserved [Trypanosoma cruzi]EAN89259.1 hypothetical protein, conserved [Trypanosoma cruzi]KAF8294708.1 hypothetical protein TcYC6_0099340 [Trypanosoma cruzi]PWV17946.1 hypothetical protein C3747_15g349c [Trypanosoma cruzi]RNC54933.1 hypothetical protein TcCL_ESM07612 [Trypanosoma cruzi]|eukprot:XP_811110.1 hypothetical protein [Trypanosoma cruzi strain CL Brener]